MPQSCWGSHNTADDLFELEENIYILNLFSDILVYIFTVNTGLLLYAIIPCYKRRSPSKMNIPALYCESCFIFSCAQLAQLAQLL